MAGPHDRYIIGGREAIPEAAIWAEWLALPAAGRLLYRDYLRRRSMDAPIGPIDLRCPDAHGRLPPGHPWRSIRA
jgi:hypothetical protein